MASKLEAISDGQACLFCRRAIGPSEAVVKIAGVLVAHDSCARSSRRSEEKFTQIG